MIINGHPAPATSALVAGGVASLATLPDRAAGAAVEQQGLIAMHRVAANAHQHIAAPGVGEMPGEPERQPAIVPFGGRSRQVGEVVMPERLAGRPISYQPSVAILGPGRRDDCKRAVAQEVNQDNPAQSHPAGKPARAGEDSSARNMDRRRWRGLRGIRLKQDQPLASPLNHDRWDRAWRQFADHRSGQGHADPPRDQRPRRGP